MQFSLVLLSLAGAALAKAIPRAADEPKLVPAPGAAGNAEVSIQALTHIYMCVNSDFTGACSNFEVQTGVCYNLPGNWNDAVSSLGPDKGTTCTIWENNGCSGRSISGIVSPGIFNLNDWNFNDIASSVRCN